MISQDTSVLTFFVVGCQRCGTTWVDAALRGHSEVFLPQKKQSYFFDRYYDKGIDWFMERFRGVESHHLAIGEVATGYCLPEASGLLAKHFPDVKLIMVMRNPIDRAYSNYQSRKIESGWNSFEQAIESDQDLLIRGQYMDQIEGLLKHYDREQMLFLLYDDLHNDDKMFLKTILDFICVESSEESKLIGQRKNAAMFPNLKKMLHQLGLKSLVNMMSQSWVGDKIRRSRKNKGRAYQPMKKETKQRLQKHFAPYNSRLSKFLERDVSSWNVS